MNISTLKSFFNFTTVLSVFSIAMVGCSSSDPVKSQPAIQPQDTPSLYSKIPQAFSVKSGTAGLGLAADATVQEKVDLYLQLLQPNGGDVETYAQFMSKNPTWPNQSIFSKRMQQALLTETDKNIIDQICQNQSITTADALSFCAQQSKMSSHLIQQAKYAWTHSITKTTDAQTVASVFSSHFTAQDQWERFNTLESRGLLSAASQQIQCLQPSEQKIASAILSLRRQQPTAENLISTLSASELKSPGLVYARLRWLRTQNRNDEAAKLWQDVGLQVERNSHQKRFWIERNSLIHSLLDNGDNKTAYALASVDACNNNSCEYDSTFLAGWIALRKLNKASESVGYFKKLTQASSIITTSRGYYWLGRAYQDMNNASSAKQTWQQAAQYPTTFYGQMAIAELENIHNESVILNPSLISNAITKYLSNIKEPSWSSSELNSFKNNELIRAAQILVEQNDLAHARPFMLAQNKISSSTVEQAMNTCISNQMGLADDAVTIARYSGAKGVVLLKDGWPRPYTIPASSLPPGLELGVMRQESSFNPVIVSPSNAYGLMQLLPSTAREVAVQIGLPAKMGSPGNLVVPDNNIKLGTAYLEKLLVRFNNVIPYAVAGYNGGPNRVKQWIAQYGDPASNPDAQNQLIDWIEQIPYTETRNYVQRVIENTIIYQTKINQ
ncbi:Soluble lytic murein transglycosylase or regulatory protein s (may contain LysM/invasin domain) (MltE) (PDB:153L) [Commensalibacter communis]|uniref:lytic transglycosylase domain-containing protein n=1 Tax=Commensalibacter communis TaxID=2972786 RepID=UPI0022FF832D|nr:lytic transglycosylase domain-containing protein [Commensalibacter communis]CAI3923043.1 Soluble lytic murein transglycosylase or regulatory protein s (may contain LysM/invasin domain) (MltE) (PDB:153L) [Commensalibacter communis]CAI3936117.1 Soluble lytic murein transglycosylase or regulatory protein s (may contain LysM/invasin domain) (MltE) (PDB:153L) [Commensalibacter communis]